MNHIIKERINEAVEVICQDIQEETCQKNWIKISDEEILFELVLSILGSQNKYEIALAFAQEIKDKNLLSNDFHINNINIMESRLYHILITPLKISDSMIKYRFPKTRAKYISENLVFLQEL